MYRLPIVALVFAAACSQDVTAPRFATSTKIDIIGGDAQVDTVMRPLPAAVTARARDTVSGRPQKGLLVNWVVVQGGGSVFAGSSLTDDSGFVKERWTLGPTAGPQILEARAVDPETGTPITFVRITATGLPGRLATAHFTTLRARVFGGDSVPLAIVARDSFGNAVRSPPVQALDGLPAAVAADAYVRATMPGQFRYVVGADTFRLFVHVPGGAWRSIAARGDSVWTQTGQLLFAAYSGYFGDTTATYEIDNYRSTLSVRDTVVDSISYAAYRYVAHRAATSVTGVQGELDYDYATPPNGARFTTWGVWGAPWSFARTDGVADSVVIKP